MSVIHINAELRSSKSSNKRYRRSDSAGPNLNESILNAVKENKLEEVRKFLEHAPGIINAKDDKKNTLLHIAAEFSTVEIVRTILDAVKSKPDSLKALVLAPNKYGLTALHRAAALDKVEVMKELLRAVQGETLKELVLMDNNPSKTTTLHLSADWGHNEAFVKELLKMVGDETLNSLVLARDKDKETALHYAASNGNEAFIRGLLRTVQDKVGDEMLRSLVLARDKDEKTALIRAVKSEGICTDIIEAILLGVKHSPQILKELVTFNHGGTVLHRAVGYKQLDVVKVLLAFVQPYPDALDIMLKTTNHAGKTALELDEAIKSELSLLPVLTEATDEEVSLNKLFSEELRDTLKDFGIAFEQNCLEPLTELLSPSRKTLHLITGGTSRLTAIKVYQALPPKELQDEYLLTALTKIPSQGFLSTFGSDYGPDVLMIMCDATPDGQWSLYVRLSEILKKPKKRLLLIGSSNHQLVRWFIAHPDYVGQKDKNHLSDLTPESQEKLLSRPVNFQGERVPFNQLIDGDPATLLEPNTLALLLEEPLMVIGQAPVSSNGYDEHYYIDRTFQQLIIKQAIVNDKSFQDLLTYSQKDFQQACTKHRGSNIHWLKNEAGQLIWQQSQGSLAALRQYIDDKATYSYPPEKLDDFLQQAQRHKVMLIANTPGMGKSTVLTRLSQQIKTSHKAQWVVRLDLNNYIEQWRTKPTFKGQRQAVIDFVSMALKLETPLEKLLFRQSFQQAGKVTLLFDGFDEISNHQEVVLDLLQELSETSVETLWVTTRPHTRKVLEDRLHYFSYTLKPFSKKNQIEFLSKFWQRQLAVSEQSVKLTFYAEKLIDLLAESIHDKEKEFTGVPLQSQLLAETYQDQVKEFCESDKLIPKLPARLGLMELYDKFIARKEAIYKEEKITGSNEASINDFIERFRKHHQKLALQLLFTEQQISVLPFQGLPDDRNINRYQGALAKIGIIQISNDKPYFIHRTFAEYYAADFLAQQLTIEQPLVVQDFFLQELFLKSEYQVIRTFLNERLQKNPPPDNLLASYSNRLAELVVSMKTRRSKGTCDVTLLHIVCREGHLAMARFLTHGLPPMTLRMLVFATDYATTLLHDAVLSGNTELISWLLETVKTNLGTQTFNSLVLVENVWNRRTALSLAATYSRSYTASAAMVKLMLDSVQSSPKILEKLVLDSEQSNTILSNAATDKKLAVMQALLLAVKTKPKILKSLVLATDANQFTALHCAVINRSAGATVGIMKEAIKILVDAVKPYPETLRTLLFAVDKDQKTALHWAVEAGDTEIAHELLKHVQDNVKVRPPGALVRLLKATDKNGRTALQSATQRGTTEIIQELLDTDIDPLILKRLVTAADDEGMTALQSAANAGNRPFMQGLLAYVEEHFEPDAPGTLKKLFLATTSGRFPKKTLLHLAASSGNIELVQWLLDYVQDKFTGAQPGITEALLLAEDGDGKNILHSAATAGKLKVIQELLKHLKATLPNSWQKLVLASGKDGRTVLQHAASSSNKEVMQWLLEEYVGNSFCSDAQEKLLFSESKDKKTILHSAVSAGKAGIVQWLLEIINTQYPTRLQSLLLAADSAGKTVLHWAAEIGKTDIVQELLQKAENRLEFDTLRKFILAPDGDGKTVLHRAAHAGNLKVVQALLETANRLDNHRPETLKTLIFETDSAGKTALHWAADLGKDKVVQGLLQAVKANFDTHLIQTLLNTQDNNGNTPQELAANVKVGNLLRAALSHPPAIQASLQQSVFLKFSTTIARQLPDAEMTAVRQGLYLPAFESRGVAITGQCAAITRASGQLLFLEKGVSKVEQLLASLEHSAGLYERLAAGLAISAREQRLIFDLSGVMDSFAAQLNLVDSSLPSSLSPLKSVQTLSGLAAYVAGLPGNFALHLVSAGHVVAVYRVGESYSYFDSNVAWVSGIGSVPQLLSVVAAGISAAGYALAEEGLLVEHFAVKLANQQLMDADKKTLLAPIVPERSLLAAEDQRLGLLVVNGASVSRVVLYDLGAQIGVDGLSRPIEAGDIMTEVSLSAASYLKMARDNPVVRAIHLPLRGTARERALAQQVRELLASPQGRHLQQYQIQQLLQPPIAQSLQAAPYQVAVANSPRFPDRLLNAAGRIGMLHGGYSSFQALRHNNTLEFFLGTGEMSFSLLSQLIEDRVVRLTPRVIQRMKGGLMLSRGVAGLIASPFDIADLVMASVELSHAEKHSKAWRDSIAGVSFAGGSLLSSIGLTALSRPGVGSVVGLAIMLGQGVYSGASMVAEYQRYNLTLHENLRLFLHGFSLQLPPQDILTLEARQQALNALAADLWQRLNASSTVLSYASGLGDITWSEPLPPPQTAAAPRPALPLVSSRIDLSGMVMRVPQSTVTPSRSLLLMGYSNWLQPRGDHERYLSRLLPALADSQAQWHCLPALTEQRYDQIDRASRANSAQGLLSYCNNAILLTHQAAYAQALNASHHQQPLPERQLTLFDLQLVNQGVIVGRDNFPNEFLIGPGNLTLLGGDHTQNRFILSQKTFSGIVIGGENATNTLDLRQYPGPCRVQLNQTLGQERGPWLYQQISDENLARPAKETTAPGTAALTAIAMNTLVVSANLTLVGQQQRLQVVVQPAPGTLSIQVQTDHGILLLPETALLQQILHYQSTHNRLSLQLQLAENQRLRIDIAPYQRNGQAAWQLVDKQGSQLRPLINSAANTTTPIHHFELINRYPETVNQSALAWYTAISAVADDVAVYGTVQVNNSFWHFGSQLSDSLPLTSEVVYLQGNLGADIYTLGALTPGHWIINNQADDQMLDSLLLPNQVFTLEQQNHNLQLCLPNCTSSQATIQLQNYWQHPRYQHLQIIDDRGQAWLPQANSSQAVPFYPNHAPKLAYTLTADTITQYPLRMVEVPLSDLTAYREGNHIWLTTTENTDNRTTSTGITLYLQDYLKNPEQWQAWQLGSLSQPDSSPLNSQQLAQWIKLAPPILDAIDYSHDHNVTEPLTQPAQFDPQLTQALQYLFSARYWQTESAQQPAPPLLQPLEWVAAIAADSAENAPLPLANLSSHPQTVQLFSHLLLQSYYQGITQGEAPDSWAHQLLSHIQSVITTPLSRVLLQKIQQQPSNHTNWLPEFIQTYDTPELRQQWQLAETPRSRSRRSVPLVLSQSTQSKSEQLSSTGMPEAEVVDSRPILLEQDDQWVAYSAMTQTDAPRDRRSINRANVLPIIQEPGYSNSAGPLSSPINRACNWVKRAIIAPVADLFTSVPKQEGARRMEQQPAFAALPLDTHAHGEKQQKPAIAFPEINNAFIDNSLTLTAYAAALWFKDKKGSKNRHVYAAKWKQAQTLVELDDKVAKAEKKFQSAMEKGQRAWETRGHVPKEQHSDDLSALEDIRYLFTQEEGQPTSYSTPDLNKLAQDMSSMGDKCNGNSSEASTTTCSEQPQHFVVVADGLARKYL